MPSPRLLQSLATLVQAGSRGDTLSPNPERPADASPPPRFAPGTFIDHHCIIRPLGSGGMADLFVTVLLLEPDFRARQPRVRRNQTDLP